MIQHGNNRTAMPTPSRCDPRIRAVIFDLDGTLVHTAPEIGMALNRTLVELGFRTLANDAVQNLIGRGIASTVERALDLVGAPADADIPGVIERFEALYNETVGTEARVFDGVVEGLELLRDDGYPMSIVTNKLRNFSEILLERLELKDFFIAFVAGDDGIRQKPHGDMLTAACAMMKTSASETMMIGDSANDVTGARNAGCPVWCVRYGYNEGRAPETLGCDRLLDSIEEAARLLRGLRATGPL